MLHHVPHSALAVLLSVVAGGLLPIFLDVVLGNIGFDFGQEGGGAGGGIFIGVDPWVYAQIIAIVGALNDIGTYLYNLGNFLQGTFNLMHAVWSGLAKFFQFGWLARLGGLIGRLLGWLRELGDWLKRKLGPIIEFIKRLRAWYDRYYRQHILPMINLIQKIRRYLLVLRLLHIHFATQLDNLLLRYETYLNRYFLTVRQYLNLALNWASLATNPVSLGRMVLVSVAGRRAMGALVRAVTGLPLGHFFPSASSKAFAWERAPQSSRDYTDSDRNPSPSEILAPLLDYFSEGSFDGEYGPTGGELDTTEHLLWGDEYIAQYLASDAAFDGLTYEGLSLVQALQAKAGNVYNGGVGAANLVFTALAT